VGVGQAGAQTGVKDGDLRPKGPLPTRNSEPLNTPFLSPIPAAAYVLRTGESRIDVNLDVVNNLLVIGPEQGRRYETDFEEQRLYLGYARGLGSRQEIGVRLPLIARNGGFLDEFIKSWHEIFGFQGGGRGHHANGLVLFRVTNADGKTIVDSTDSARGIGDTVIEYRYALTELADDEVGTRGVGAAVRALVKLPTGDSGSLFGSGAADAGIGLALTGRPTRNFAVHGNVSEVFVGDTTIPNLSPRGALTHWLLSVEYLLDGRTSLVFQTDDNPAPFRSGIEYADRPRRAFTFGAWHQVSPSCALDLSISENDFSELAKTAPDFVLSFGSRWRL
jgi:hypothetical protein